jgi:tetratricopeptide (TPR) repeat protein
MPVDLSEAVEHHRRGDLDRAERAYQAALAVDPNEPDALHLLGLVALQRGDPSRAVALIGRAVALRPVDATFHASLAEAYWGLRQIDRAVDCGRVALRLAPTNPGLHCNLGSTLMARGDIDAAVAHFRQAVDLAPEFAAARNNLGRALRVKGETQAALEELRRAVGLDPGSAEARSNLGDLLLDMGQPQAAMEHCVEAIRLRPGFNAARIHLGNVLHALGRLNEAAACFREAIRLGPGLAGAHAGLAGVLEELGDLDGSEAALHEAVRHDPGHAGALARLATRLGGRLPDSEREAIERLLALPALPPEPHRHLLFGLAHTLDGRGDYDRAARLIAEANALQRMDLRRQGRSYDRNTHRQFVSRLIAAFSRAFFEQTRGAGLDTEVPVFIVGMPRSGTSLVEQILASHPRVFGAGELDLVVQTLDTIPAVLGREDSPLDGIPQLARESTARLARRHLDALRACDPSGSADRIVDKMPENVLYLGLIAAIFPRARLIHCRRDLRDVALSCWMTHFARVRWACDLDDIGSRIREYRRLMEHWRRVLPVPVLDVDYEAMVGDLEATARRLIDWCGLAWDPACLEFHKTRRRVRTTSVAQVRQPLYATSIGRWRNYQDSLASLFSQLEFDD